MTGLSTALWAMHPAFLNEWLKRSAIEAMLPEGLAKLAGFSVSIEAKGNPDPLREGATVILPLRGVLGPSGMSARTYTDVFADRMRSFAGDAKIGAIVLDIQSPGGYVFGTQEAGDAIIEAREAKPVIAVANTYAYSAAHWLATQASAFYCTPSGEVGSVGVRAGHVDESGFEEKIGMKTTLIASHPDKVAGHPYGPLSDADREEIQAAVDESNVAFIAAIARGRRMAAGDVPGVHGTGKAFSAKKALAAGAIDGIATLREVIAKYGSSRSRMSLMRRQAAIAADRAAI